MTDTSEDELGEHLSTLLQHVVEDHQPDLSARARAALRTGNRIKVRRRFVIASTSLAGLTAAAVLGVQVSSDGVSSNDSPGFAAHPSANSTSPTQPSCLTSIDAGTSLTGQQALDYVRKRHDAGAATGLKNSGLLSLDGTAPKSKPGENTAPICVTTNAPPQHLPVRLIAPGWRCTPPGDDKFTCTSASKTVEVTLRPARMHSDYLNDPDKADPQQVVTDIHDGVFATIERVKGEIVARDLEGYLVWK